MVALWLPLAGDHGPAERAVAVCTGSARRGATAPLWEAVAVVSSDARGWGRGFLNGRHPVLHQRQLSPGGSHYGHVLGTNLLVSIAEGVDTKEFVQNVWIVCPDAQWIQRFGPHKYLCKRIQVHPGIRPGLAYN